MTTTTTNQTSQSTTKELTLTINGTQEHHAVSTIPLTLTALLSMRSITVETVGIAVAVNDSLVLKSMWDTCVLKNGDTLEIVLPLQGG